MVKYTETDSVEEVLHATPLIKEEDQKLTNEQIVEHNARWMTAFCDCV